MTKNPLPEANLPKRKSLKLKSGLLHFAGTVVKESTLTASFALKSASSLTELLHLEVGELVAESKSDKLESKSDKLREDLDRAIANVQALLGYGVLQKDIDEDIKLLTTAYIAGVRARAGV